VTAEGVQEAARCVRPYLPELIGPDAAKVDAQLAELLVAAAQGEDVAMELRAALESYEGTRAFLEAVLENAPEYLPPQLQSSALKTSYSGLPGDIQPVEADKYRCPKLNDYVWYRPSVGVPVPECPTCHVLLVLA
jgi:hypothetical protein